MRIFAAVDGPDILIEHQRFHGMVEIFHQPTYGRVLFAEPCSVTIRCCFFGR